MLLSVESRGRVETAVCWISPGPSSGMLSKGLGITFAVTVLLQVCCLYDQLDAIDNIVCPVGFFFPHNANAIYHTQKQNFCSTLIEIFKVVKQRQMASGAF